MKLTADVIHGFSQLVLSKGFDDYKATPEFHRELWEAACSDHPLVAVAAPRGHGKSTALTHCYTLAACLFKDRRYVIIVSDTYEQAVLFLQDIRKELITNDDLISLFGIEKIEKDAENDLIVRLKDNHKFRITAKGAEQRMRGLKWDGARPDLIVCHEEGTPIWTPESGWIDNRDYPNAKRIHAHEAYEVEFEDGSKEVVSSDHRYLVGDQWKYVWEMRSGDDVNENTNAAILNDTRKDGERVCANTIPSRKQKLRQPNGKQSIMNSTRLQNIVTMFVTKSEYYNKLKSLLKTTPAGKRQRALYDELEKCRQRLRGLIRLLSNEFMKQQESNPYVMDIRGTSIT